MKRYQAVIDGERQSWTEHHRIIKLSAPADRVLCISPSGGVPTVSRSRWPSRCFRPNATKSERAYDEAMGRMAHVSAHVAQIQQDNLLDVQNWVDRNRIRIMEMEWVDGFDLRRLLTHKTLDRFRERVSAKRWKHVNEVIVTAGPDAAAFEAGHRRGHRPRLPGRLGRPAPRKDRPRRHQALEHHGQADRQRQDYRHRLGLRMDNVPAQRTCTPTYAAPEVLDGGHCSPQSDLASLGYVLIEMLSGVPPFPV